MTKGVLLVSDDTQCSPDKSTTLSIIKSNDGDIHIRTRNNSGEISEENVRIRMSGSRLKRYGEIVQKFNELLELFKAETEDEWFIRNNGQEFLKYFEDKDW